MRNHPDSSRQAALYTVLAFLVVISLFFWLQNSRTSLSRWFSPTQPADQAAQAGGAVPATYYVSPNGDDEANPGTLEAPWKTIERALDSTKAAHLRGGDTLYLRAGTYRYDEGKIPGGKLANDSLSGTSARPTVISGYQGEQAKIYGSARLDSGWQKYGGEGSPVWSISWSEYVRSHHPWIYDHGTTQSVSVPSLKFVPEVVVLDGAKPTMLAEINSVKNAYSFTQGSYTMIESHGKDQADLSPGSFYYESDAADPDYGDLFVWLPDNSEPNGQPLEVSLSRSFSLGSQHDVRLSNLSFAYFSTYNLAVAGSNNILDHIRSDYAGFSGAGGICASCTVKNSSFSYNGNTGSALLGNSTRYENSAFTANNAKRYYPGWHCGGIKAIPRYEKMVFTGNTFKDTYLCPGLWLDTMKSGNIIENNTFINNAVGYMYAGRQSVQVGLFIEITDGTAEQPTIIRNNVFYGNELYISASQYTYAFNNIFQENPDIASNRERYGLRIHGLEGGRTLASHNHAYNNIFYGFKQSGRPVLIITDPAAPFQSIDNTSDYNLFFSDTPAVFAVNYGTPRSVAVWQGLGYDQHSVFADPHLNNLTQTSYSLSPDSPAIDAGTSTISGYASRDMRGSSRSQDGDGDGVSAPDIGPYEYPAAAAPHDDTDGESASKDTAPPVISITSPLDGDDISGTIKITAKASDDTGIDRVQYFLGTKSLSPRLSESPYTMSWNTTHASNGKHELTAKAWDEAGNLGTATVTVDLHNVEEEDEENDEIDDEPDETEDAAETPAPTFIAQYFPQSISTIFYTPSTSVRPARSAPALPPSRIARNLKRGDSGSDVRLLQKALADLGYSAPLDGVFDGRTEDALAAYQASLSESGIQATGVLENATLAIINSRLARMDKEEAESSALENSSAASPRGNSPIGIILERIFRGAWLFFERISDLL